MNKRRRVKMIVSTLSPVAVQTLRKVTTPEDIVKAFRHFAAHVPVESWSDVWHAVQELALSEESQ